MVPKEKVNEFLAKIRTYYLKERPDDEKLAIQGNIDDNIFVTEPAQGACIIDSSDYFNKE
jgi:galactokinase